MASQEGAPGCASGPGQVGVIIEDGRPSVTEVPEARTTSGVSAMIHGELHPHVSCPHERGSPHVDQCMTRRALFNDHRGSAAADLELGGCDNSHERSGSLFVEIRGPGISWPVESVVESGGFGDAAVESQQPTELDVASVGQMQAYPRPDVRVDDLTLSPIATRASGHSVTFTPPRDLAGPTRGEGTTVGADEFQEYALLEGDATCPDQDGSIAGPTETAGLRSPCLAEMAVPILQFDPGIVPQHEEDDTINNASARPTDGARIGRRLRDTRSLLHGLNASDTASVTQKYVYSWISENNVQPAIVQLGAWSNRDQTPAGNCWINTAVTVEEVSSWNARGQQS